MNKVIITGNLTKTPDVRFTQSGTAYTRITVAVARAFSKDRQQTTDFLDVVIWDKQAEFCGKYFSKGSRILVEGRIQNSNYTDKNGVKQYRTEIVADNIEFAGGGNRQQNHKPAADDDAESYAPKEEEYTPPEPPTDDLNDMPF